jgi:hypothetical protein
MITTLGSNINLLKSGSGINKIYPIILNVIL